MSNFDKLSELCTKQSRGLHLGIVDGRTSLVITHPDSFTREHGMGGTKDYQHYAGMLLRILEGTNLRVVK